MPTKSFFIDLLKVEKLAYPERLTANSIQGLVNRSGPKVFLDYGVYDDPSTRTTNSVQMTDENWFKKYRPVLKRNDLDNLDYYRKIYPLKITQIKTLDNLVEKHIAEIKGMVVWDPKLIESVNLALMYSGLKNLLVVHPDQINHFKKKFGFKVAEDLRSRFTNRVELYLWAFQNLFSQCKVGQVVCMEPEWKRAEFTDYVVQNKLFTFSLSSYRKGGLGSFGQKLLLLLIGGPFELRNFLYFTHLDGFVRRLAVFCLASNDPEVRLGIRIQKAVAAKPYPTIFGWHTQRDNELAFMLLISANGMRLGPTFMANNYSFHSQLPKKVPFKQNYINPNQVHLDKDKVYLTFTLSDGDQFTLMNTAEVGNWRRKEHGKIPFNWEVQPLLAELAPSLLGYYYYNLTKNDLLVAGPSGAGYVIPPLVAKLPKYLKESARLCDLADIRVTTSYNGDPPKRVVRQHNQAPGKFLGFLAGYFHLGRTPMYLVGERPFVAYAWPHANEILFSSEKTLVGIRKLLETSNPTPRFIACHLFAYNITLADVYDFVKTLDPKKVKVVRADEFLLAAKQFMHQGENK